MREALRRFDFDTVMFPINFVQYQQAGYRGEAEALIGECQARSVGVMVIKSVARGPWGGGEHTHHTWYEPFGAPGDIQPAVDFVLSQRVTGLCTAGDPRLLPLQLDACQRYMRLSAPEQESLITGGKAIEPLFA
jgi:hypothetical protein